MYGYENKSGLLGSTVVGFVFYSSINVGVTIFYQVGERCRFAYQSPPLYLTKAIS
jgi:hypothetical protein